MKITTPYQFFTDTAGEALGSGQIYVGVFGMNPMTHPQEVYSDADFQTPLSQPITTDGGIPVYNGAPVQIYAKNSYSILVTNKNDVQIYSDTEASQGGEGLNLNERTTENAALAANLEDGTTFVMGGAIIVRDSSVSLSESALADLGQAGFKFYDGAHVPFDGLGAVDVRVVRAAYLAGASVAMGQGDSAVLQYDSANSDDFQAMVYWVAGQRVAQGAKIHVEPQEGLHNVSTIIQMTDNRNVIIEGSGVSYLDIDSATFVSAGGDLYTVTVTVGTELPSRVEAGFAVGGQNVQGDGAANALNTGFIVESVAGDRLSFTSTILIKGVAPTAFTTPDSTASLGLTPNQLVIPYATIRANEAGWDGAAQDEEGFITCLSGGRVDLESVGISYNGIAGDNDMLFARDAGSEVYCRNNVVIAGTGAMIARSFNEGNIATYRSFLGGGATGSRGWQGSGGGTGNFTRTMMGSVSSEVLSGSSGGYAWFANGVISGGNYAGRTTYPNARIEISSSRIRHATVGVGGSRGNVYIDSNSSIEDCTTSISLAGGVVEGDPTIANNTNSAPEHNVYDSQGGYWKKEFTPIKGDLHLVGIFTGALDFPEIAANSYEELTITATGVALNDFCFPQKNNAGLPAQAVSYEAFVATADEITIRAKNYSSSAINPTASTFRVMVQQAS